ncbi:reverse transcriptase domain, reverse transcriptase zinc-binding domain protein, partial [Tanacetum coccineum]
DPTLGNWNMDTSASSHLNDSVYSLSDFVRDNNYTVEFDTFGFYVKDFMTRRVLLRYDSTGDLYPVMKPSTIPHAFLTSQYTWNQHLGHPESEVLREMKKGKAKVAWEAVCLPQREGGLGIRRIEDFNIALMATDIWCMLINKESSTSMWFDRWADPCPLADMLTVRNIVRSDFSLSDTVSDLISNGSWRWPHDRSSRFPNVVNIPVPDINNDLDDVIVWHDVEGVFQRFSVAGAWDSLRLRADVVDWYHVVWFPRCIPRHAIHMWLVIKEKLKTQDRLRQWDVGPSIDLNLLRCPLCEMVPDSHSHLFFECSFASQVWFQVRAFTGMSSVSPRLVDVLTFLIPTKGSSVSNVISQIVLAAMTYCLWNEQNSRLFKNKKSTTNQIV